jgi:hypothetical protein
MKKILGMFTSIAGVVVLNLLLALSASAGCSPYQAPKSGQAAFRPAAFTLVSAGEALDPIVGFWNLTLTSDGQLIDSAYVQWHSDGTEIMNSSRAPATGSFCMGVWEKVGNNYVLNHFAKSFDPDGNFVGPANIRERVHLDRGGQSYSGHFTLDQYDTQGNLLVHIAGDVAATRITVDTPPPF